MPGLFSQNEEPEVPGTYEIFKAEADALLRNCQYIKAIDSYTTALLLRPDDRITLVCRSKCYLLLGDTTRALRDAEASLVEDKNYPKGMFQKAEALFNKGDFEMALVFYHRGNKLRPEMLCFRIGIQKAQEVIYKCIGSPDIVKLNMTGDLSFFTAQEEKKSKRKGALCTQKQPTIPKRKRPTEKFINEKTLKQMLGELYGDRKYLEKILREIDNKTFTGKRVTNLADSGMSHLDSLSEFWEQVKPIYARKYESRLALNRGRAPKISPHDYVLNEIERIEYMMAEENYQGALQRSKKVMKVLSLCTDTQLSNRMTFAAAVNSIMGNAYLQFDDFENAEKHHHLDLIIGEENYIDEAELRALDNLGRVYARSGKYQKAIEMWERKLPLSRGELETTWLCHELGRCYLELGNSHVAREYGERSLAAAEEIKDDRWRLHAYVLISQADVKSGRLSSSLINFERAVEIAGLLKDAEAIAAIRKAISDVNDKISEREMNRSTQSLEAILAVKLDEEEEQAEDAQKEATPGDGSIRAEEILLKNAEVVIEEETTKPPSDTLVAMETETEAAEPASF